LCLPAARFLHERQQDQLWVLMLVLLQLLQLLLLHLRFLLLRSSFLSLGLRLCLSHFLQQQDQLWVLMLMLLQLLQLAPLALLCLLLLHLQFLLLRSSFLSLGLRLCLPQFLQ
jgi:hypothetical protein